MYSPPTYGKTYGQATYPPTKPSGRGGSADSSLPSSLIVIKYKAPPSFLFDVI